MNVSKTHTAEETTKGVPQPWEDLPDKDAPKTSDVDTERAALIGSRCAACGVTAFPARRVCIDCGGDRLSKRSEEHTSELQTRFDLVCLLLLEKKKFQFH